MVIGVDMCDDEWESGVTSGYPEGQQESEEQPNHSACFVMLHKGAGRGGPLLTPKRVLAGR